MPRFGVNHESGDLKRVLVHHPGKELELANRDPATHHFDCAVNVKQFQNDHQKLIDALKEANVEVLEVNTLLQDNPEMRKSSKPSFHTRLKHCNLLRGYSLSNGSSE
jgi:arginine deiminase